MSDANQSQTGTTAEGRMAGKDITPVLTGWTYEAGTINVRKITGADGKPKLQMRLDLGLLQMELTGRPDGHRPNGYESLLEFYEDKLEHHKTKNGTPLGFALTRSQCQALREEAMMYYHRYLSLFVLDEYSGVVRDTARNLRVLDLCVEYAGHEQDRFVLEQYRPYITMMNTRATAKLLVRDGKTTEAEAAVVAALRGIRRFFKKFGQPEAFDHSNEVRVLKGCLREIRKSLPANPLKKLEVKLSRAVKEERYEDAARLRDEISKLQPTSPELPGA